MKQQTTDQSKCRMCGADVDEVSLSSDSMSVGCLDEWFCSCKCANQAVQDPTFAGAAAAVESARMLAGAKDSACELHTTERPSDLIDDGYGIRARGGLVYFG